MSEYFYKSDYEYLDEWTSYDDDFWCREDEPYEEDAGCSAFQEEKKAD